MHQCTHGHYYRSESLYMIVNFVSPREHNMAVHILKLANLSNLIWLMRRREDYRLVKV